MIATKYKYSLLKGSKKLRCPACGQKRFVPYVDNETGEVLESFGRCDRENSCGYHERPEGDTDKSEIPTLKEEPEQTFVDRDIMLSSLRAYEKNIFVQWLKWLLGDEALAHDLAKKYLVGTTKKGEAIFWQVDKDGRVYNGHCMEYLPTGKRNKQGRNLHLFTSGKGYRTALFGAHLLIKGCKVAIVESEKTAMLASIYYPECVWLACASANGLTSDKMNSLKGHEVFLFCDADEAGRKNFAKAKENLKRRGIPAKAVDVFPDQHDGFDMADSIALDLEGDIPGNSKFLKYPIYWDPIK